ncbi:MAG TPA: NnrS family protein [Geminicoccaceae bacterium]
MRPPHRRHPSGRRVAAHRWFFPAALALALAEIPLWTAAYAGWIAWPPLASTWHGHEMLFGYALAVVAGFLLARLGRSELALLLGAWLLARAVAFGPDPGPLLAAAGALFPLLLAVRAGALFLPAAKKGSNRLFAPIFVGFLLAELLYRGGQIGVVPQGGRLGLGLAVDLVTLLLVLMGGRVIPAATAGALHRRGQQLRSRVQAKVERATLASLIVMMLADLLSLWGTAAAAGLLAGVLTAIRLARWRTAAVLDQPELWSLHLGYAWLALGLLAKGAATMIDRSMLIDLQHALTIGGLGTLSLVMILRTSAARAVPSVAVPRAVGAIAILITLATLARLAAPFLGSVAGAWALLAAAALWSIGAAAALGLHFALAR